MNLYTDTDAPQLDRSVRDRLRNFDRGLVVTFSRWAIDPTTSQPFEFPKADPDVWEKEALDRLKRRGGVWLLEEPRWYLWAMRPDGAAYLVNSYSQKDVPVFGHRQIAELEADYARRMTPGEVAALLMKREEEAVEKAKAAAKAAQADRAQANAKPVFAIATGELDTRRDKKFSSYGGQTNFRSSGENGRSIILSDKELGIER